MKEALNRTLWWLDFASHLLDWRTPRGLAGFALLFGSVYAGLWMIRESSGTAGSQALVLELCATTASILGAGILGAKLFRWPLLYRAVYQYTEKLLIERVITGTTVLLGEGAGGALAVGMVSKAIQELGYPVPLSIVVDCEFIGNPLPKVGSLLPEGYRVPSSEILIVGSYAGTGSSLRALKQRFELEDAKTFCFIIGETLLREPVDYFLYRGSRAIIPWPQTNHKKRTVEDVDADGIPYEERQVALDRQRLEKTWSKKFFVRAIDSDVLRDIVTAGRSSRGIGPNHPDEALLERRLALCSTSIWASYHKSDSTLSAYYIVFPLNAEAKKMIERAEIKNGAQIEDAHIARSPEDIACIYIAMLFGSNKAARGFALDRLTIEIEGYLRTNPSIEVLFARPGTTDGLTVMKSYSFSPLAPNTEVWSLQTRIGQLLRRSRRSTPD